MKKRYPGILAALLLCLALLPTAAWAAGGDSNGYAADSGPTLSRTTLTYGEALGAITLSGTMTGEVGQPISGSFAWNDPAAVPNATVGGSDYAAAWTFTPADTGYAQATGTANITVNRASFTFTVTMADYLTGGAGGTLPTISYNPGNGAVSYQYKLKTADDSTYAESAPPTAAGEYTIKATIAATANYEQATATADFKVTTAHARVQRKVEGSLVGDIRLFATFEQALAYANGIDAKEIGTGKPINVTLTLLDNCLVRSEQTITRSMTLDLGGKVLTTGDDKVIIASGATVTIDCAGDCSNTVNCVTSVLQVNEGGTLTIKNGRFRGYIHNYGTLTITGGTVSQIYNYGTLTIEGGTFNAEVSNTYGELPAFIQGDLTITGGLFNGWVHNSSRAGTLTIKGGTFATGIKTFRSGENVQDLLADGYGYRYYDSAGHSQNEWYQEATTSFTPGSGKSIHVETAPLTDAWIEPETGSLTFGYDANEQSFSVIFDSSYSGTYSVTNQWYLGETEEGLFAEGNKTGNGSVFYFPAGKSIGMYYVGCAITRIGYTLRSNIATVTVSKAPRTIDVSITGWTYGDTANAPTVTGVTDSDTVTIEYKLKTAADETYSTAVPTAAGEYTVRATVAETDTHTAASDTADFTIAPKAATVTALDRTGAVYDPAPDLSAPVVGVDYTIEGLLDGDTVAVTLTCDANMDRQGEYDIVPDAADPNYTFTLVPGKLKLTDRFVPPPAYPGIAVPTPPNGTISVRPANAAVGTTVTITATPDRGYTLDTLTVTDRNGNALELTDKGDGQYTFKMPAGQVVISASFAKDSTEPGRFADVPAEAYYYDAVLWAAGEGITGGVDATHFDPNGSCTREQLVTFLWRAAGCPVVNYAMDFTDVAGDDYYSEAVRWAASLGLVGGYGDGLFGTGDCITREQFVTILFRYAVATGMDAVTMQELVYGYGDAAQVPGYAIPAFNWALAQGIVQGSGDSLMPGGSCTRAQAVTMLYRLLGE